MVNPLRRAVTGFLLARDAFRAAHGAPAQPAQPLVERRRPKPPDPQSLSPIPTQRLFGIEVANLDLTRTVERIIAWSSTVPARTVITANLDHVMKLETDEAFQRAYAEADLVTADGMPFIWVSRREGTPLVERVAGSDLILPVAGEAARAGRSIFLFGSTLERLETAAAGLRRDFPGLEIKGIYAPPFGFERDAELQRELVRLFRTVRPDIIFVALGAPKQEIWSNAMAKAVRHGVFLNIGGGLDFLSGDVRRAPTAMQKTGLEWLWRAGTEPRRLGPRYARILARLPGLYRMHRRDRIAHEKAAEAAALDAIAEEADRSGTTG